MLTQAFERNPDLAVAEAKVTAAQAELNQMRLTVAKRVATLYHERTRLEKVRSELAESVERVKTLSGRGVIGMDEVRGAVLALAEADAKLAQARAEIRYVLGVGGGSRTVVPRRPAGEPEESPRSRLPRPELDLEEWPHLANRIEVDWGGKTLAQILQALQAAADNEVAFLLDRELMDSKAGEDLYVPVFLPKPVRLVAAMQAIVDHLREERLCFAFTEYGVVLLRREAAETMPVPTLPADVPLYGERR
jgi:hypothetical protein